MSTYGSLTSVAIVTFCRQQHFNPRQTSVFLGIIQTLMEKDFARDSETGLEQSYSSFQSLLLAHSVDRSPRSVQVFQADQVAVIVDYVAHSADELSHQVTQVLADMSASDADQSFPLTDVLRRVNESRGPRDSRVTQDELERVLLQLEVENKLMFVRDGDDPVVMLV
ncbi:hypothetical protein P43SY_001262 [Pythium insidiosum]|uniref:Uncharacterized protein n=1 Tax=Pythium insidiosum TaxID=114742 RepID=A0AAD5M523_PYTIN|nr:hypothetical protein P43SY_001262 [Pythium insidiosum]